MVAINIENYFQDSNKEYKLIVSDLQSHLNKQSAEEVIAFVDYTTEQAMNKVWEELRYRYDSVSKLDDTIPDNPTKEDQQTYIHQFFKLTDPNKVMHDLKKALRFNELESDYQQFINDISQGEYGDMFNRYQYPTSFFNGLKQGILLPIQQLTDGLKVFTEAIGQHAIILDNVKGDRTGQSIIKGGASLLGLLVGVPFAGAGVGALMGDDSQVRINQSMGNVIDGWNHYIKEFNQFLLMLEDQYRLAIMALYGGTMMRVNQQLESYRLMFDSLALLTPEYLLTITEQEKKETEVWVSNTIIGIKNLIDYQQWHEAIRVSQKFFQFVKNNPVIARTEILDQHSTIYLAHLYYYTAYQEALLEEYKNGHRDQFYEITKQLFSELYLFIVDKDIKKLNFHSNNELVIRFLKEAIRRDSLEDALILIRYIHRISERVQKYGLYYGEHFDSFKDWLYNK